ncbi:MAG: alkaline phosphatase family protein [Planctomycetes bacterium]|nr:alkaline phosphatase family protein [Planctomycetota bacterium]
MSRFKRVIVLGFDGLEPDIIERMVTRGELPAFARLAEQGVLGRVATTFPAQTPVAWSSFATGLNPGGHGIFDFIARDPKTYLPDLSFTRYEQKNAFTPPRVVNRRQGRPFWETLSERGLHSAILRCPCSYPSERISGHLLYGMGVPDLRGSLGTATFYSSAPETEATEGEHVVRLEIGPGELIRSHVIGPINAKKKEDFRFEFDLQLDRANDRALLRSAGAPKELELKLGEWSDWLKLKFKLPMLQSVRGMTRFLLLRLDPVVELFASPVNFDPQAPPFPIGNPPEYPRELESRIGTYYTTGMVEENDGLNHGRLDEDEYLAQCELVWSEREAMLELELDRRDDGFVYCLFDTSDRVQHMFWRFTEPDHPANGAAEDLGRHAGVLEDVYRRCDAILGRVLARCSGPDELVITLSDHGFTTFRRSLNLNSFLRDAGLLVYRSEDARNGADFFANVDWERTKAYAVGFGAIYLNRAGRESKGSVTGAEAEAVMARIEEGLLGLADPATGRSGVRRVVRTDAVYAGPCQAEGPDLLVCCEDGYRASSRTALGGAPAAVYEDNLEKWSGDHIVDPELVPGFLGCNRPLAIENARLIDLAPTILEAFGLEPGAKLEGRSLWS